MWFHDYARMWQLYRLRLLSEDHYREFQAFQAGLLADYLSGLGVHLRGKRVLDLGSGLGGYGTEFARLGASVISMDLAVHAPWSAANADRVRANAVNIPLSNDTVDLVFCASLIEHVPDPSAVLHEMERVAKPGGHCYVSFPPYFSPMGGHEFAPLHYLGQNLAIRLKGPARVVPTWFRDAYEIETRPQSFTTLYSSWGLYKMTLGRFSRELRKTGLKCLNVSTRYMPVSFIRWPLLGEVVTWHAQYLLQKTRQNRS